MGAFSMEPLELPQVAVLYWRKSMTKQGLVVIDICASSQIGSTKQNQMQAESYLRALVLDGLHFLRRITFPTFVLQECPYGIHPTFPVMESPIRCVKTRDTRLLHLPWFWYWVALIYRVGSDHYSNLRYTYEERAFHFSLSTDNSLILIVPLLVDPNHLPT